MFPHFPNGVVCPPTRSDVKESTSSSSEYGLRWFQGETVSDAYHLNCEVIHLPRYPVYRCGAELANDFPYFYKRSEVYLNCQASRFTLVGGQTLTLIERGVLDPLRDLSSYWNGFYWEHFANQVGFVIQYDNADGYRDFIEQHPDYRVITAHPFDSNHIPSFRFYLENPALVVRLNNKGRIHELSNYAIPSRIYTPEQFCQEIWRDEWTFPLVVKLTEPSGGGDGVVICKDHASIDYAKRLFAGRKIKIEPYIEDIKNNYNISLNVAPNGQITFVGGSIQKINGAGKYRGNYIDLNWKPNEVIWNICTEIADKAYVLGWYGICGLDIIETESGEFFFIDPNFRLNGSTPFYLMRRYFDTHFKTPILETGYFHFAGMPVEFLNQFYREIQSKMLFPIGFYYPDCGERITRIYAALVTNGDLDKYTVLKKNLVDKHLVPGLKA